MSDSLDGNAAAFYCRSEYRDDPYYGRYWRHFEHMQRWSNKHKSVVQSVVGEYYNNQTSCSTFLGEGLVSQSSTSNARNACDCNSSSCYNKHLNDVSVSGYEGKNSPGRRKKSKSNRKQKKTSKESDEHIEEKLEVQFDQTYLDFIAQSAQYRKDRDSKKLEEAKVQDKQSKKYGVLGNDARIEAPKEQPGLRRTHEIQFLYGEKARKVHGMETAQQLTFQQSCDRLQPITWPSLPLNIVFDDS